MELGLVGVNHNNSPIEVRERLNFTESKKIEATDLLLDRGLEEVIVLSTCNRSEIYFVCEDVEETSETVKDFFSTYFHQEDCRNFLFKKKETDVIRHLYQVCLGMDSVVIGEDQILGQVKDAMMNAMELRSSKKILNRLFQEAVTTAKRIKSETQISQNPLSLSYIGVKRLKEEVKDFTQAKVLLIGLGKMGLLALKHLEAEGVRDITLCNRNYAKTLELQSQYPFCKAERYQRLAELIPEATIIICATSSPHTILSARALAERKSPLHLLDLALPRDIDESVGALEDVFLYNIDSLKSESDENIRRRKEVLEKHRGTIEEAIAEFESWRAKTLTDPVIRSLNERCSQIKQDTLSYIYRKVPLEHRHKKVIEKMLESALKRMIREPIRNLKQMEEEEEAQRYMDMLSSLFELR